jgi:DNA mismatch endonuclease (patch repair protein)
VPWRPVADRRCTNGTNEPGAAEKSDGPLCGSRSSLTPGPSAAGSQVSPAVGRLPAAPQASSPGVRALMQGNRAKDTRPEVALRSALHRLGLRFRKHAPPVVGVTCRADVVFRRARVAVFVDGCFWHRCPLHGRSPRSNRTYWRAKLDRNVARDRRNDAFLGSAGWTVVRVWEHEEPLAAARRVQAIVARREAQSGSRSPNDAAGH